MYDPFFHDPQDTQSTETELMFHFLKEIWMACLRKPQYLHAGVFVSGYQGVATHLLWCSDCFL